MQVGLERGIEPALGRGGRELADQSVGADEARLVTMLDRPIREGDAEVGLPRSGRAHDVMLMF